MLPWPLMLVWASLRPFCSQSLNQGVGRTSLHLEALVESFLPLPARGGLAVPWRVDASLLPLPPGHVVTLPASLVSASSPCKTRRIGPRATLIQDDLICTDEVTLFQVTSHSEILGDTRVWGTPCKHV